MDKDKRPAGVNGEVANWHCGVAKNKDMINWIRVSDIKRYNTKGEEIGYDAPPCVKSFDGQRRQTPISSLSCLYELKF